MKKVIFLISLVTSGLFVNAQGDSLVKNKKGHVILPEKGDIAIGFNTIPVLDVLLRAINFGTPFTSTGGMVGYTSSSNNQVTGKYFLDPKTAVRVRFGVNTISGSVISKVQDASAKSAASQGTPDDIAAAALLQVDDKITYKKNNLLLSAGLEKRRGYRRLQGFYGAEIGVGNEGAQQTIKYGNAYSDAYEVYYTNFATMTTLTVSPTSAGRTVRPVETKYQGGLRVGLRGFVGIEYFVFAKISVAAEYGWGYSIATRRAATTKREVYNNGQNGPQVFTEKTETDSREVVKGFSVDNNSGSAFSINNTLGGNTALSGGAGALTLFFHF